MNLDLGHRHEKSTGLGAVNEMRGRGAPERDATRSKEGPEARRGRNVPPLECSTSNASDGLVRNYMTTMNEQGAGLQAD